ncbi:MAG: hypothetical protein HYX69_02940 [Planctomycetia bacterium]|nr:hypothetical protein [Planctomycetia bacterium]
MKTERRHELHTNTLANWLADRIDTLRPYSRLVAGVVLAVVVLAAAYAYFSSQSSQSRQQGWRAYFTALDKLRVLRDPQDMISLAQAPNYQRSDVGYWAQLGLADYYYGAGVDELFADRAAAGSSLRLAVTNYTQVATQTQFPLLAERASLGLARAYESMNELEKARHYYELVISKWPEGAYAAEAKQRLDDLANDSTKRFYDWFFAQAPPRQPPGGPGTPGAKPGFGALPDEGTFAPPKSDSDRLLSTPPLKPESKAGSEEPASESPAGEQPDEQKSSGEGSTPDTKPADKPEL